MKTTFLTSCVLLALTAPLFGQSHTHGSMVGYLQPTSVVVWTRASALANVSVLVNSIPSTTGATETAKILATAATDYTARINLSGLSPNTKYYYATHIANTIGTWGEFTTPPASGPALVTFLASADVYDKSLYAGFDKMRTHGANFYLALGDMPYADTSTTQAMYWQRHKDTRNAVTWLRFIEKFPIEAIWDDHEVLNDWDKSTNPILVAFGKKAFFDYFPFPSGSTEIYRTIKWGSAVEVFLLDLRAHRDANKDSSSKTKSMLGATQKTWLKNGLTASTAKFKILCSSIPVRWGSSSIDSWDGFAHEREEIFDYILKNKIRNVVILSGDSHLVAVHNHRAGIREYQCGPLATIVRPQIPAGPEVRFRASTHNFIKVTADSRGTPATLKIELFEASNNSLLFSDVIKDEAPAQVTMLTDIPNGGYQLKGPHYFHSRGRTVLPNVAPGQYNISFEPDPGERYIPTDLNVTIPPNGVVVAAGRWRETPGAVSLFADSFAGPLTGYTVIDEPGSTNGPSAWLTSGGVLLQANRIDGPTGSHDADRPGTFITVGSALWQNYTVAVRAMSHDKGRVGVVFRFKDKDNFYRVVMDEQRPLRRLEKKVQGVYTTLAEQRVPYVPHNYYDIKCSAVGTRLRIYIDDQPVFDVTDTAHVGGKVGLYTWQNKLTEFEDLVVTGGHDAKPTANNVFTDHFNKYPFSGWTIVDHATKTGKSAWSQSLDVLLQLSNIGDRNFGNPLARLGTVCLANATVPNDMQFTVSMLNYDDDGMGLVFRYKDAANHYRFYWDRQSRLRQLEKVVGGTWSVIWKDDRDYNMAQWYRIRVLAVGSRLRLYINGEPIADVTDTSHASGTVGTYSFRSTPIMFDRAIIQRPHTELPVLAAVTRNLQTRVYGRAPQDGGDFYGLGLSLSRTPPIPLAWLNATDPRVIELAPDRVFILTLSPSPLWTRFAGKLDATGQILAATINWPNLPSLTGLRLYAAGWTGDISRVPIKNVFPTLEIIYP